MWWLRFRNRALVGPARIPAPASCSVSHSHKCAAPLCYSAFMKLHNALLSAIVLFSAGAQAAEPADAEDKVAEVAVTGTRNPELKPYRVMSAGLDAFDEYRALAPNAPLKFSLLRHADATGDQASRNGVNLRLTGTNTAIPIPVAADGTFILPRSKEAFDDDADLVVNQKKSLVHFWLEVRTPGVPPNARRLGDLRLECQVIMAIAKKELNFAQRTLATTALRTGNWCMAPQAKIGTPLPDWSIKTTLTYGATQKLLGPNGKYFFAPIQDKSLPDDALIAFESWGGASAERKQAFLAQWPLYLKSSANKWGAGPLFQMHDKSVFSAVMALKPGSWAFNLESQGRELNLGARRADTAAAVGVDHTLEWYGRKLTLNVTQAGSYAFTLNAQDPDYPVLQVRLLE